MMERESTEGSVSEHEAGEETYKVVDVWNLMKQLEAEKRRDPQAIVQLIQVYEQILEQLQPDKEPNLYASMQTNLGSAYSELPTGDRATNLTQAIACYQQALRIWTPETAPFDYALIQTNLGSAYRNLPLGDRGANVTQAIAYFQNALRIWTPETAPFDYAMTQTNLGNAYLQLPTGDRSDNLVQAVTCFQNALRIWTPETTPLEYANTQNSLGTAYRNLPTGDRGANVTQAIACYQQALRIWTPETAPFDYALIQTNLGSAYSELPTGDRATNLTRAIACYQQALRIWTPETAPLEYATTQSSLGTAYGALPIGDRSDNLVQAISCFQNALRIWTPEIAPFNYAMAQTNLGTAYSKLPTGDRATNLTRAIACYQQALRIWTLETAPFDYALIQTNLGTAYLQLPTGDLTANLRQAIMCFQQALRIWTLETAPFEYAMIQTNLGITYSDLRTGDQSGNLAQAIAYFQNALRIWTPETAPFDYASNQANLGNAYLRLPTGDRGANVTQAIACYQQALRIWTLETAPFEYAFVQDGLGNAHLQLPIGDRADNLVQAIACYLQALRIWTLETAPFEYAMAHTNLGITYSELPTGDREDNLAQAIACYQQALRIWTLETAPFECRTTNRYLADLHFVRGEWYAALEAYRAAMDAGERLYRAGLSAESKATEVAANVTLYRQAAFSAVRCGEMAQALLILESGKTRLLAEALRLRVARPTNVPDEIWLAFEHAGAAVRAAQAERTIMPDQERDPVQFYTARKQAAQAANAALEAAIEQVRAYAPTFLLPFDIPAVRALLPDEHTVLVAFCITGQGSLGFVVSHHHGQRVQVIEVPNFTHAQLHGLFVEVGTNNRAAGGWLGDYGRYLAERTPGSFDDWQATITRTLTKLGQDLLTPILFALPFDVERIIFLPSAELFLLPLHAIPLPGNGPERVCDRYQVSYAPSLEVLADTQAKAAKAVVPELYAVINPQADPALFFTPIEGEAIAKLFTQHNIDKGQAGTKQHVIAGVQGRTYVHFSCHGSYDWNDPSESGLDLADGRLTLAELRRGMVDLSAARLVTLSACETGISDILKGSAEEYVGIPAGFLLAGVPCVVSSLWEVSDLSTALLMERFYRNHLKGGTDFVAALREAQVWARELSIGEVAQYAEQWYRQSSQRDKRELYKLKRYYRHLAEQNPALCPFAHPYYWAAFTVNGL